MKRKPLITVAALCALTFAARAANPPATPDASAGSAATKPAAASAHSTTPPDSASKSAPPALPPSLAADKAKEEAIRAHIQPSTYQKMATPPPAPRAEIPPARPAGEHVWVPGHWAPQEGEWKWVSGQWRVPATPTSVWIEPRYDPAKQRWSAGYWQPDRPDSYENEAPAASGVTRTK